MQFIWSLGGAGFPAVQQARLIAIAPGLASATIALNSSVTYLGGSVGASIGSTAWTLARASLHALGRLIFIVAALACSYRGERTAAAIVARSRSWHSCRNARLIVLIAGNFFVATSFFSVSGLLNEIATALGVSVAQAGLLIAAFALTAAFFAPVLATAGSRFDRRKLTDDVDGDLRSREHSVRGQPNVRSVDGGSHPRRDHLGRLHTASRSDRQHARC